MDFTYVKSWITPTILGLDAWGQHYQVVPSLNLVTHVGSEKTINRITAKTVCLLKKKKKYTKGKKERFFQRVCGLEAAITNACIPLSL